MVEVCRDWSVRYYPADGVDAGLNIGDCTVYKPRFKRSPSQPRISATHPANVPITRLCQTVPQSKLGRKKAIATPNKAPIVAPPQMAFRPRPKYSSKATVGGQKSPDHSGLHRLMLHDLRQPPLEALGIVVRPQLANGFFELVELGFDFFRNLVASRCNMRWGHEV